MAYWGVALVGLRWFPLLVALGRGAYPLWDAVVHPLWPTEFVTEWYAWACSGFDLMVAGTIVWQWFNRWKWNSEICVTPKAV